MYAELFSIGVSPMYQGKGVGSLLLAETEQLVSKRDERPYHLQQTRMTMTLPFLSINVMDMKLCMNSLPFPIGRCVVS